MKLREVKFKEIPVPGLSIYVDDKEVSCGFIGEALRKLPVEYADYEIESTNYFFDIYVIHLKSESIKPCEHAFEIPNVGMCCGVYSKSKRKDGRHWANYPECKDVNCPLRHPSLLGDAILEMEVK